MTSRYGSLIVGRWIVILDRDAIGATLICPRLSQGMETLNKDIGYHIWVFIL